MNEHYEKCKRGQWTFNEDTTHETIVFRKGSREDSVLHPNATGPDDGSTSWLVASSEWGNTNDELLGKVLDVVNAHEAKYGKIK